jgi:prolipoprotein diacylglyceryl transferase
MIRDGGLASHGAAVALPIGLWIFARINRKEFAGKVKSTYLWALDRIMIVVAIGGALVRLGNLFNSEIYGGATSMPWGFIFVRNGEDFASHPTQIYEALCYLILFALLAWMYYKKDSARRHPGLLFGIGLIGVFLSRFLIEFVKNRQEGIDSTMGTPLNMGQWLSIPFILLGIFMIWYGLKHKQNPKPLPTKTELAEMERKVKLTKRK